MDISFKGKIALVTGGGRGIGRDIAKGLVAAGAHVFALSRTNETLNSLQTECPGIQVICCDLADWDATRDAVENAGPIDLLVNNAGIQIEQHFLDITPDAFDRVMNINLKAVVNVSQVVAKGMIARGVGGSIVNISSQASQRAIAKHSMYGSSKSALEQLTKVMALELGPHKIRVNAVCPTVVLTDMGRASWSPPEVAGPMLARIPLGRFAETEDVVHPVLYLLSDKAAMIHGAVIPVDGGFWAV